MIKRTNQNLQETFCACVESAVAARYIKDDQVSVPCANHSEDAFCACVESAIATCKFENDLSRLNKLNIAGRQWEGSPPQARKF